MATERGWAIAGPSGLYIGWWPTRREAILGHIIGYRSGGDVAESRGLTTAERNEWNQRKRRYGDRAVRISMRY